MLASEGRRFSLRFGRYHCLDVAGQKRTGMFFFVNFAISSSSCVIFTSSTQFICPAPVNQQNIQSLRHPG